MSSASPLPGLRADRVRGCSLRSAAFTATVSRPPMSSRKRLMGGTMVGIFGSGSNKNGD